MTHTFNKYCLKHGHDWQYNGWQYKGEQGEYKVYECKICGARQAKWTKRAGLLAYPVTVKPRNRERLE